MTTQITGVSQEDISPPANEARVARFASRYQKAYFHAFLIAMVLCWSPSKLLAYFAPWIALAWFLLASKSQMTLRNLVLVLVLWIGSVPLYALLTPEFALPSAALSLLTYGSFFFIAAVPAKFVGGGGLAARMATLARWVVLFQGSWGIIQGVAAGVRSGTFDGTTGDAVAGTIRPFGTAADFSNPMFAVNMALLLIVLLPSLVLERKGKLVYSIGVLSLILASVVHVLLFLGIAFVASIVIYYPSFFRRKSGCLTLAGFLIAALLALSILSTNFATLRSFIQHTVAGRTPRAQVVVSVFTTMPEAYPWMPFIGLGPGQFSSRAGLIGTGLYFGSPANPTPIPLLPPGMSEPFRENVLDLWLRMTFQPTIDDSSSTFKPFFSWLSVFTEFGAAGSGVVLIVCAWLLLKTKRYAITSLRRVTAASFGTGLMLVFMLGLQENYWEVSQAIFVGLILLKVQYANLVYNHDDRHPHDGRSQNLQPVTQKPANV